jgi:hypothetical protein
MVQRRLKKMSASFAALVPINAGTPVAIPRALNGRADSMRTIVNLTYGTGSTSLFAEIPTLSTCHFIFQSLKQMRVVAVRLTLVAER